MSNEKDRSGGLSSRDLLSERTATGSSRRAFLGQVSAAATLAAGALASPNAASAQHENLARPDGLSAPPGVSNRRVIESFEVRVNAALRDAALPAAKNTTNGDEERYRDGNFEHHQRVSPALPLVIG